MIVGTRGSLNPTAYTVLSTQLGPTLQVCVSWKITLFSMMVTVNTFHAIMSLYFSFQTSKDTPFSFCQAVNICKVVMNHRQWPLLIKLEKNLKRLQIRTPGIALNCRTEWSFWGVEYVTLCSYVHVLGIKPLLNPSGSWKIARAHYTERHFQPDKCTTQYRFADLEASPKKSYARSSMHCLHCFPLQRVQLPTHFTTT